MSAFQPERDHLEVAAPSDEVVRQLNEFNHGQRAGRDLSPEAVEILDEVTKPYAHDAHVVVVGERECIDLDA